MPALSGCLASMAFSDELVLRFAPCRCTAIVNVVRGEGEYGGLVIANC